MTVPAPTQSRLGCAAWPCRRGPGAPECLPSCFAPAPTLAQCCGSGSKEYDPVRLDYASVLACSPVCLAGRQPTRHDTGGGPRRTGIGPHACDAGRHFPGPTLARRVRRRHHRTGSRQRFVRRVGGVSRRRHSGQARPAERHRERVRSGRRRSTRPRPRLPDYSPTPRSPRTSGGSGCRSPGAL